MPLKKIVPKPDIDIVELNQSDLDSNEASEQNDANDPRNPTEQRSGTGGDIPRGEPKPTKKPPKVKQEKQRSEPKVARGERKKEKLSKMEDSSDEPSEQEIKKKAISQGRLNALAAGRKRAHQKREEKKKEAVETLRLQLKKELEEELRSSKKSESLPPANIPPENIVTTAQVLIPQKVNRQSNLRIIEDSTMNQHNGYGSYGGFQIPQVGGIIKKIGRKLI